MFLLSFYIISGFFAILHSWLNAFAEMLRFADRLFYKVRSIPYCYHASAIQQSRDFIVLMMQDWWNSSSFSSYYRTWNVVVHDWLYTYIYKDCFAVRILSIPYTCCIRVL